MNWWMNNPASDITRCLFFSAGMSRKIIDPVRLSMGWVPHVHESDGSFFEPTHYPSNVTVRVSEARAYSIPGVRIGKWLRGRPRSAGGL